jgi:hypothetical protein
MRLRRSVRIRRSVKSGRGTQGWRVYRRCGRGGGRGYSGDDIHRITLSGCSLSYYGMHHRHILLQLIPLTLYPSSHPMQKAEPSTSRMQSRASTQDKDRCSAPIDAHHDPGPKRGRTQRIYRPGWQPPSPRAQPARCKRSRWAYSTLSGAVTRAHKISEDFG